MNGINMMSPHQWWWITLVYNKWQWCVVLAVIWKGAVAAVMNTVKCLQTPIMCALECGPCMLIKQHANLVCQLPSHYSNTIQCNANTSPLNASIQHACNHVQWLCHWSLQSGAHEQDYQHVSSTSNVCKLATLHCQIKELTSASNGMCLKPTQQPIP